jgi:hypothetical protein
VWEITWSKYFGAVSTSNAAETRIIVDISEINDGIDDKGSGIGTAYSARMGRNNILI